MISKVNVGNVYVANSQNISNAKKSDVKNNNIDSKEKNRVEEIKKSIQNGTYKIDLQKTAQKIADTLL